MQAEGQFKNEQLVDTDKQLTGYLNENNRKGNEKNRKGEDGGGDYEEREKKFQRRGQRKKIIKGTSPIGFRAGLTSSSLNTKSVLRFYWA